jgi:hypothetical protein
MKKSIVIIVLMCIAYCGSAQEPSKTDSVKTYTLVLPVNDQQAQALLAGFDGLERILKDPANARVVDAQAAQILLQLRQVYLQQLRSQLQDAEGEKKKKKQ